MINKIKNHKIIFSIFVALFVSVVLYLSFIINNTVTAYKIIKNNYSAFNYPNTIEVHSGTIKKSDDIVLFVCRISAENAFKQVEYDYFIADEEHIVSVSSLKQYRITMPQSTYKEGNGKNISVFLINFLIDKDW